MHNILSTFNFTETGSILVTRVRLLLITRKINDFINKIKGIVRDAPVEDPILIVNSLSRSLSYSR